MPPIFIILFIVVIAIPVGLALGFALGRHARFGILGWTVAALVGAFAGWWLFSPGYEWFTSYILWDIPLLPSILFSVMTVLVWLHFAKYHRK